MIAQWNSSLSVLPVARVMIAQWDSSLSVLPVAWVQFPATAEYFKGLLPGCSHSANPPWASVAENGSISPQWHHTTCGQRGGRPKSNHGQIMADRKKNRKLCSQYQCSSSWVAWNIGAQIDARSSCWKWRRIPRLIIIRLSNHWYIPIALS